MGHPGSEAGAFTVELCGAVLVIAAEQMAGLGREGRFEVSHGRQRERGEGVNLSHLQEMGLTDGVSLQSWPSKWWVSFQLCHFSVP